MSLDVAALYGSEHERLCRYFHRRIGNRDPSLVDDLAGAVWLRAWERRDRYRPRPGVPPAAWLMAIARNTLVDYFRAEHPTTSLDARGEMGLEPIAADPTGQTADTVALQAAIDALTGQQRAVIVGRFFDGRLQRDMADIATYWGVKALQQRALVNLRRALGAA